MYKRQDADHIGGMDVVLYKFDCKTIIMPDVANNTRTYDDVVQTKMCIRDRANRIYVVGKTGTEQDTDADKSEASDFKSIGIQKIQCSCRAIHRQRVLFEKGGKPLHMIAVLEPPRTVVSNLRTTTS